MQTDRSITDLTRDVAHHLSDLFRNEIKLATAEATDSVKSVSGGVGFVVAGAAVGAAALTIALLGAAEALAPLVPRWAAMGVVAVGGLMLAVLLILVGKARMKPKGAALPATRQELAEDIRNLSEHLH